LDWWIAGLAARQYGVVARGQLLARGMGRRAIDHRVERGSLHVLHRGVYAVGHRALTVRGRWMAAVIACGSKAVLSHRAAAALWEIRHWIPPEVTVPPPHRGRAGILVHQLPLPADEVTTVDGIPVTTVPRTLFDLGAVLSRSHLERAVNEAEIRGLGEELSLSDLVDRHAHRYGVVAVRETVATLRLGAAVTHSELEARFRRFVRSRGLAAPAFNFSLLGFECDCVWPAERLVVELDGRAVHGTAAAFERDRARDRVLNAAGWRVVRITWRQLHEEAEVVASDLMKMLGSGKKEP
jgi:very-short-patch-repair endonuclease